MVPPLGKAVWSFLKKLKIELPCNPAITLLGIYTRNTKAQVQMDTCTPMFTTALFAKAKMWKYPKCPLIKEQIKKMWCTHTERNITES